MKLKHHNNFRQRQRKFFKGEKNTLYRYMRGTMSHEHRRRYLRCFLKTKYLKSYWKKRICLKLGVPHFNQYDPKYKSNKLKQQ